MLASPERPQTLSCDQADGVPKLPGVIEDFVCKQVGRCPPVAATQKLADLVADFVDTLKRDDEMRSLCNQMFMQVKKDERWGTANEELADGFRVQDFDHFQRAITGAVSGPPGIYVVKDKHGNDIGDAIGLPLVNILDPLNNTAAAYDLFRMKRFNTALKKVLDGWGEYLQDEDSGSNCTLNQSETGWFGERGMTALLSGLKGLSFEETWGVKPEEAQAKYKSWDAFFTREFRDIKTLRPIRVAEQYTPIYNSCESFCFRVAHNVKLNDTFWLKTQNYSLYDIFGGDPHITKESLSSWAPKFVGASVYQAFLDATDYHRWHSPIKGTVLDTTVIPGTYYGALLDEGNLVGDDYDPRFAQLRSMAWLSVAATRGIIIMEPQDESSPIALLAFVAIGMVEVSTIDVTVSKDGAEGKPKHVDAGDQLGMFHFGGSTYVTIVKPKDGYEVVFKDVKDQDVKPEVHYWLNEIIGRVVPINDKAAADDAGSRWSCVIC